MTKFSATSNFYRHMFIHLATDAFLFVSKYLNITLCFNYVARIRCCIINSLK